MSHVFISYSKKNKEYALRLADFLLDHGFDIWIDDRIDYGENWLRTMVNAVRECAAFVVIMTPEAEASRWVELEVAWAHRWEKPMFPVLRSGDNWPVFELTQYVDCTGDGMPDSRFVLELSQWAPSKHIKGVDITPRAEPEHAARPIEQAEPPPIEPPTFDVYAAITEVLRLRDEGRWFDMRALLGHIAKADRIPAWFDVSHYIQEMEAAIQQQEEERRRDEREAEAERRQHEREAEAEREYAVLRQLAQQDTPDRVWSALQVFWETYEGYDPDGLGEKLSLLDEMLSHKHPPKQRAEAGRKLDKVGDLRPGIGLRTDGLPDIDWVEIPEGQFIYQKNEQLTLPTFYIARYPITYRQFQAFVDADDGFHSQQWWQSLAADYKHKAYLHEQQFKFWNHPRENVSWWDAVAFCRWLSTQLGCAISLPTSQQWEKAARGTKGQTYPYTGSFDSNKGNTKETYLGQTSAVGLFVQGESPYGVLDMSGNVWEWCLNEYHSPAYTGFRGSMPRILRGGSWDYSHHNARCTARGSLNPVIRRNNVGFRVVCFAPQP